MERLMVCLLLLHFSQETDSGASNNIDDSTSTPSDLLHPTPSYTNSSLSIKTLTKSYAKVQPPNHRQRRRSTRCGYWSYWRYTCNNAYMYSTYFVRRNWYKVGEKLRYFQDDCCRSFHSRCNTKKRPFSCPGSGCPIGYEEKGSSKRKRRFAKNSYRTSKTETWMEVIQDEIPDLPLPGATPLDYLPQNGNSTFIQKATDNYDVKATAHRQRRSRNQACPVWYFWRFNCKVFYKYTQYGFTDTTSFFAEGKVWWFKLACCPMLQSHCAVNGVYASCPTRGSRPAPPTEHWTNWSTWSICEGTCENSKRSRKRVCFKSNGNHVCTEDKKDKIETKKCVVKVDNIKLCGRLLSNNDVANLCCFIIRSKSLKKTFILTDHILAPDFDETCGSCAYSPYEEDAANSGKGRIKTEEKVCLKDIGPDYTCCSQHNGAFCERFKGTTSKHNIVSGSVTPLYWEYLQDKTPGRALVQSCSNECKKIASCPNPGNKWCQSSTILGTDTSERIILTEDIPKNTKNCQPTIPEDEEPVKQSAEFVPNALTHATDRRKRGIWHPCAPHIMWQFNCNKAMHYNLYHTTKNWYYIQRENKERYFKHDCCPSFQSNTKCWKKLKRNDAEECPSNG